MIRITGGTWRSRRLAVPAGIRPTTELVRKAAFDILGPAVRGARVLDAAAGSGAYGLEALSRGAAHVTFSEADRKARDVLSRNVESLGAGGRVAVERVPVSDLCRLRGKGASLFDVIFFDPPFAAGAQAELLALLDLLAPDGILFFERGAGSPAGTGSPAPSEVRRYGSTRLLVFRGRLS